MEELTQACKALAVVRVQWAVSVVDEIDEQILREKYHSVRVEKNTANFLREEMFSKRGIQNWS